MVRVVCVMLNVTFRINVGLGLGRIRVWLRLGFE